MDFRLDFWISQWISGFHSGFLDFSLDFWISGFQFGFLQTVYEISFVTDPSLQHDSMITAQAITTIQTRKNSINHWVLYSPFIVLKERTQLVGDFSGNPTLMLATIRHFTLNNIHSDYVNRSSTMYQRVGRLSM